MILTNDFKKCEQKKVIDLMLHPSGQCMNQIKLSFLLPLVSESTPAMIKPNAPVVYRWDDESNGEIYTDRSLEISKSNF